MSRKKRLQKKKMKEDQLVTLALQTSQWIQEHFTQVIVGVAVLIAGVAIVLFTANARRNTAAEAKDQLAIGLNQYQNRMLPDAATTFLNLADRFSGHDAGVTAMYFLGESYLAQAQYDEALMSYQRYLDNTEADDYFYVSASIGKAISFEGQKKFSEAAQTLEQVLQSLPENDPRYTDIMFRSAQFFQRANSSDDARRLFEIVSGADHHTLSSQADIWLAILE